MLIIVLAIVLFMFQSTLPVWGGTYQKQYFRGGSRFQSTLPVWGGTLWCLFLIFSVIAFQSTLPVWGGTEQRYDRNLLFYVSIHPPRVGRDCCWLVFL